MRFLLAVSLVSLLLACAHTDQVQTQVRDHMLAGRGEQALALLEKAIRENPDRLDYQAEDQRNTALLVAQWLGQAEVMRSNAQPEVAAELYRRVLKYDAPNQRARAGLAQLEADGRHRAIVADAEKLLKDDKFLEALDLLRP